MKPVTISLTQFAAKNIRRNAYRSAAVWFTAALVAGSVLATMLILRGATANVELNLQRLGADILIVPWGTFVQQDENQDVRMVTRRTNLWMPASTAEQLLAIAGVNKVSPQLYVAPLPSTSLNGVTEGFVVAYDPVTDFSIRPWLESERLPGLGEAVAGSELGLASGDSLTLFGYVLTVVNRMETTSTEADRALFVTFDTALALARQPVFEAETGVKILPGRVSAFLVRVRPEANTLQVYSDITAKVGRIRALKSTALLQAERNHLIGLTRSEGVLLAIIAVLSVLIVALVFTLVVNERRQEIGALRALGARRTFVIGAVLAEGAILALAGGFVGLAAVLSSGWLFRETIASLLGFSLVFPSLVGLTGLLAGSWLAALLSVSLGALWPIARIAGQEAALSMRE